MRKAASKLNYKELLENFIAVTSRGQVIIEHNKGQCKEDILDIPTSTKDKYSGLYAEILSRMGENEENIVEALKAVPLLHYKDGEERYFCKCKCTLCNKAFYIQDLHNGMCTTCNETK